jgi:hypothetical protein
MNPDIVRLILGVFLVGAVLIFLYLAYHRRRLRIKRLTMELLKSYFQGDLLADQLGQRTREIADHRFLRSAEFQSLATAAFQAAVGAKVAQRPSSKEAQQPSSKEDERRLLSLFAVLKKEFGLTDLYRIEAWRAGRE